MSLNNDFTVALMTTDRMRALHADGDRARATRAARIGRASRSMTRFGLPGRLLGRRHRAAPAT